MILILNWIPIEEQDLNLVDLEEASNDDVKDDEMIKY